MGMSASPVVESVISVILGVVTAGISLIAGIKHPKLGENLSVHMWPVATLVMALLIGGFIGVRMRTARILGTSPDVSFRRWTGDPFNLDKQAVASRLFQMEYPVEGSKGEKKESGEQQSGGSAGAQPYFYSGDAVSVCTKLEGAPKGEMRQILEKQRPPFWKRIAELAKERTDDDVKSIVEDICSSQDESSPQGKKK